MKIKNYQDFTNEEINIRKALTGAALGAGLAISNPSISQTNFSKTDNIENVISNEVIKTQKSSFDIVDSMSKQNGFNLSLNSDILSKAKSAKLSYSIGYLQGISKDQHYGIQSPVGALFGLHIDNFSIYFDCKWFGKKDEYSVSNWSDVTVLDKFTYTYEPYVGSSQYGTYTTYESGKEIRTGTCLQNNSVINLSVGGKAPINKNYDFRGFLGVGIVNKSELTYNEVYDYWFEYTNWALINDYTSDGGGNFTYQLLKTEHIQELNVHGGVMIEGAGVFAGIGFDTNPGTFNMTFGYTFGNK